MNIHAQHTPTPTHAPNNLTVYMIHNQHTITYKSHDTRQHKTQHLWKVMRMQASYNNELRARET